VIPFLSHFLLYSLYFYVEMRGGSIVKINLLNINVMKNQCLVSIIEPHHQFCLILCEPFYLSHLLLYYLNFYLEMRGGSLVKINLLNINAMKNQCLVSIVATHHQIIIMVCEPFSLSLVTLFSLFLPWDEGRFTIVN
jgi:hypothetical protein